MRRRQQRAQLVDDGKYCVAAAVDDRPAADGHDGERRQHRDDRTLDGLRPGFIGRAVSRRISTLGTIIRQRTYGTDCEDVPSLLMRQDAARPRAWSSPSSVR